MNTGFFSQLTPRRKTAFIFAAAWVFVFFFLMLPAATRITPPLWPPWAVVCVLFLSPLSSAVVLVELLRNVVPSWGTLDDARHFNRVIVFFLIFFGISVLGYRLMLGGYGY